MRKVLIAPNAFKGSLSAFRSAEIIESAFKQVSSEFQVEKQPISDGGDGFLKVMLEALGGTLFEEEVFNPLGKKITASLGVTYDNTAIIEMAKASGVVLLKDIELNPMIATSFGTGQLIKKAVSLGCKHIIIGLGGSATVDAGVGLLQALGIKFLDKRKNVLENIGGDLREIWDIDKSGLIRGLDKVTLEVACDVNNLLLGPTGSVNVFAPQKGADTKQLDILNKAFIHFEKLVSIKTGVNINQKFCGAAGGVAAALKGFLNGNLRSGIDLVFEKSGFSKKVGDAELIITTEGKLDEQTVNGKGCWGVIQEAKRAGKKTILFAGQTPTDNHELYSELDACFSIINKPMSLREALDISESLLFNTATQVAKVLCLK